MTAGFNEIKHYEEGLNFGYEMATKGSSLKDILTTAYEVKGYVYGGSNPNIKKDTYFVKYIEGVVNGQTKYGNENPAQYHDLKATQSTLVSLLGVIGVVTLITPIYLFSPQQTGFGIFIGVVIGLPILFQAIKASSNKRTTKE